MMDLNLLMKFDNVLPLKPFLLAYGKLRPTNPNRGVAVIQLWVGESEGVSLGWIAIR